MHRRSGFTLVEVLLAALLLAVGLSAIVAAMARSVEGARHGENLYRASYFLQEKIEQLVMDSNLSGGVPSGASSGVYEAPGGPYGWTMVSEPAGGVLSKVDLAVTWMERSRTQRVSAKLVLESRSGK